MDVTRPPTRTLRRGVKLPAIARAVESSTRTRTIGVYVVIVLEKLEALFMSGLWLGPPKSPHIEEVELPKPLAVIPHQGNSMLTMARIPAITARKVQCRRAIAKGILP